jgi:hypothetical protein
VFKDSEQEQEQIERDESVREDAKIEFEGAAPASGKSLIAQEKETGCRVYPSCHSLVKD